MNYVALDLGASKLAVRLSINKTITDATFMIPNFSDGEQEITACNNFLRNLLQKPVVFKRVFLSSAPTLNQEGKIIHWPNKPKWVGHNIKNGIEMLFQCPMDFEDDGNTAVVAESFIRQEKNLAYIGIGTGISSGLVINKKIYRGNYSDAFKLGHFIVEGNSLACGCGKIGCLQTIASGPAIKSFMDKEKHSTPFNPFHSAAASLSKVIKISSKILNIHKFVIGGGFSHAYPDIIYHIQQELNNTIIIVEPSLFKNYSSLEGAYLLAKYSRKSKKEFCCEQ